MTTALYRRYRPDSFADVIGQEHVTDPLRAALRADRATHAYLFSGPRGCGKTTSARILARCLNCAKGPTDTPCGVCDSCVELARGGPGSLDVVEIDAASHGGVDDARDLRERAVFAPARDRYKVFIIDEAHMVTPQGFNALLKLVEEPPAHVKFVFATTEPEKVIGTIRSRTHHYPFRLVPPAVLQGYLGTLCEAEHIAVDNGVLPLVVRAGGGSVRDSLSVLDQLMAGASEDGVSYDLASALLGFTPVTLLDDVVGALAAGDGAALFRVVDHVVESGRDPRRFVEDLLDRMRDLIVIAASGSEAETVLRALPSDEVERMRPQAAALGAHRLSTAADIVNTGLTEMVGATSPRLLLELVLTRAMLAIGGLGEAPAAAAPAARGASVAPIATVVPPVAAPVVREAPATAIQAAERPRTEPAERRPAEQRPTEQRPTEQRQQQEQRAPEQRRPEQRQPVERPEPEQRATERSARERPPAREDAAETRPAEPAANAAPAQPTSDAGAVDGTELRRRWPEVLETLAGSSRATWTLISQHAQPGEVTADSVTLLFPTSGLISAFTSRDGGSTVSQAIFETVGLRLRVIVDVAGPDGGPGGGGGRGGGNDGADGQGGQRGPSAPGGAAGSGQGRPASDGRGGRDGQRDQTRAQAPSARTTFDDVGPEPDEDPFGPEDPGLAWAATEDPEAAATGGPAPTPAPPSAAPAAVTRSISAPAPAATIAPAPVAAPVANAEPAPAERRAVSEAVARALADWDAPQAPGAPADELTEDSSDAVEVADVPHIRSHLSVVAPASDAATTPPTSPPPTEDTAAHALATDGPVAAPATGGLAPVIDLHARTRAHAAPSGTIEDLPPAPWEEVDEEELREAGSSVPSAASGPMGATLVAKMLGGVVIDEIVDGVSDLRR
ncbi:DNA polymerase III subunit gamma and tau [Serinibacter arcticus]|uniref:DNA polymerase III subunit gamma and tau n=1 Tax=Serinibacter arcticus TaxID=1655435 RepID=UPI001E5AB51D|nr:DNA polymerase III subunit gamma and tau [Serinibacter arcticus]